MTLNYEPSSIVVEANVEACISPPPAIYVKGEEFNVSAF